MSGQPDTTGESAPEANSGPAITGTATDPVAVAILATLADGKSHTGEALALAAAKHIRGPDVPKDLWRRYFQSVKNTLRSLARLGQVEYLHKGKPVDPDTARGVLRYRLAAVDGTKS